MRRHDLAAETRASAVLEDVLARARAAGQGGVVIFDLDSTLLDNRPRQARILRDLGRERRLRPLEACRAAHFASSWDLGSALVSCGLSRRDAALLLPDAQAFWSERFFTSAYCAFDEPVTGAVAFATAVTATGVAIAYVTGRPEDMRPGTVTAMARCGLPVPGRRVHLIMKPSAALCDDDWKRDAHAQVAAFGEIVAAFDNEPMHVNDYRRAFPRAAVIHIATDHSGREISLQRGIASIPHFGVEPMPGSHSEETSPCRPHS
jgi:hypothetical protein